MNKLWSELFLTMAVVAGGCYLYMKYKGKSKENMALASTLSGTIIGERLGAVVGAPFGVAGALGGSVVGGVVGAYVGQEIAINQTK